MAPVDVVDEAAVSVLFERLPELFGPRLDVLVNAGADGDGGWPTNRLRSETEEGELMAIAVLFSAEPTTREKYDEVLRRLEENDQWPAPGLVFHAAFGEEQVEGVFEVWESGEAFETFGQTLMPLLDEVGIDAGEPQVRPVYNMNNP